MGKKSKKRNKKYSGWDSATDDSTINVHKLSATPRSDFKQWFFDHKKLVRNVVIAVVVAGVIIFLVVQGIGSIK